MITIKNDHQGYKVTFSNPGSGQRGFSIKVKSEDELHLVIDHYYIRPHDKSHCPLCLKEK